MKVIVEPIVTAGINMGGENLELQVSAEISGTKVPQPEKIDVEFNFEGEYGYSVENEGDNYVISTDHYEFEWSGKAEDVLDMIHDEKTKMRDILFDPKFWQFCHAPGAPSRLRFEQKLWIDGNAD